jgi:hypothetical protein
MDRGFVCFGVPLSDVDLVWAGFRGKDVASPAPDARYEYEE